MDLLVAWTQLKKKISELEDISIETCKIEKPREKSGGKKNQNRISKNCVTTQGVTYV